MPGVVNKLCAWIFSFERILLRHLDLPFGHSLVLLAQKPGGDDEPS